jgi:hypothetical protein
MSALTMERPPRSKPRLERGTLRETADVAAGIRRMVRALGRRLAQGDPADLLVVRDLQADLDEVWREAIAGMRDAGFSDGEIGAVLGVTGQAVNKRWPR